MLDFKFILESLRDRNPAAIARISAYFLAPGLILGSVVSGVLRGSLGLDLERPITISQLRTEFSANGDPVPKVGFAVIVEPVPSEYRIELQSATSHLWSSLDEQAAKANRDRLTLDESGISGRGPLLGVSDPVLVVVEGKPGRQYSASQAALLKPTIGNCLLGDQTQLYPVRSSHAPSPLESHWRLDSHLLKATRRLQAKNVHSHMKKVRSFRGTS